MRTALFRLFKRGKRVSRFARLAYYYCKRFIPRYGVTVAVFTGVIHRRGYAQKLLKNIFAHHARVISRAAGYNFYFLGVFKHFGV